MTYSLAVVCFVFISGDCLRLAQCQLGDVFADRYVVVKKLGWGHFSTVWMARDDRPTSPTAPKVRHQRHVFRRPTSRSIRPGGDLCRVESIFVHGLGNVKQLVAMLEHPAGVPCQDQWHDVQLAQKADSPDLLLFLYTAFPRQLE